MNIVADLKKMVIDLKIDKNVTFEINKPREHILSVFQNAKVGIHTMEYEHFGIAICEMMAAGVLTIAHNSGKIGD